MDKHIIILNESNRRFAVGAVMHRPDGHVLTLSEPTRSLEQNAKLHSMFSEVAKQATFHGRALNAAQWKTLFISGHSIATGIGADVVPGLEGEFVNIRESSAKMSVRRMNSLIEYVLAWCANNDIRLPADESYEELAK